MKEPHPSLQAGSRKESVRPGTSPEPAPGRAVMEDINSRVADVVRCLFLWPCGGDEGIADADQGSLGLAGRAAKRICLRAGVQWSPTAAESGPLAGGTVDYRYE